MSTSNASRSDALSMKGASSSGVGVRSAGDDDCHGYTQASAVNPICSLDPARQGVGRSTQALDSDFCAAIQLASSTHVLMTLRILSIDGWRVEVFADPLPLRVGRDGKCGLVLNDASVSRSHCDLYFRGASVRIRDNGSLNGTYLNGDRIQDHELREGDLVQVGLITLEVLSLVLVSAG